MKQLSIKPELHAFDTCKAFAEEFKLGKGDLILTNEYIYAPYFGQLGLECDVLYQEKYGIGEPSNHMAEMICGDMKGEYKRIFAIGGGTIIDICKVLALKNPVPVIDLYDNKDAIEKDKELILVPTTCGTGSEVTNVAVFSLIERNTKMGLAVDQMYADKAVLIPELLMGLPMKVFATSSIDALVHAMESVLSPKASVYTQLFGYKAIEMILNGYKVIAKEGPEARKPLLKDFLIASNYAGISFGNAGCAAVHAMAYPLGGVYHVAHGESNYCMLIGVFNKYMEKDPNGKIADLNKCLAGILGCDIAVVYEELEKLLNTILQCKKLHEYGMTEAEIESFADSVVANQQRLLSNNYVFLTRDEIRDIYAALY
ncbi:MAG: 4-hydroxybutyrate dehydrogenase [Lachnospiraceae bacterium]|nr:4-hydroxybutyrate dehydrogenase [Lachnospiraceae bacterium]